MKTRLLLLSIITLVSFTINSQTSVPDASFETYLETHDAAGLVVSVGDANSLGDGIDGNHLVTTSKIQVVTNLYLPYLGIEKLDGLEDFTNLESFTFLGNAPLLTSVDVSSNINLKTILISDFPNLTNLNFTGLANLTKVQVSSLSNLTTLNVSGLTGLADLSLSGSNVITSLDLQTLTGLTQLVISNCSQLSSLNLKSGATAAINYVQLNRNPLLTCVEVDAGISLIGLSTWNANNGSIFNEDCSNPSTYVPDNNFEAYLEANAMGNGIANDDKVFTSNINTITTLDVSFKSISDLTGIEDFTALVDLNASSNTLISVNVSKNTVLETLFLNDNSITSIDVSENTALKQFWVRQNNLTILDVSKNINLEWFVASRNSIQNLDLSLNTNLTAIEIHTNDLQTLNLKNISPNSTFFALGNPGLTCIQVDNPSVWTTNWSNQLNNNASFSADCSYPNTNVPDSAFENYLETHDRNGALVNLGDLSSMGNGIANDMKVFTHRINTVTQLGVGNVGLTFLTGLEDFRDLEVFFAYGGNPNLTSVDVSSNLKLKRVAVTFNPNVTNVTFGNLPDVNWVQLGYNNISSIDISGLPKLEHLNSQSDKLTSLNTASNPELKILGLAGNQVTLLDLSSNSKLENLTVYGNQLTSLNLDNNKELSILNVNQNQLISLDLSNNNKLTQLQANDNKLTSLNLKNGNNTILLGSYGPGISNFPFDIRNNPDLTCIEVNDITYATTNWTAIDSHHTFNTICPNTLTYVPDDAFETYLETHDAQGNIVPMGDPTSMGNATSINDPLDNFVLTNRINTVTFLNLSGQNSGIASLRGLEDFRDLEKFYIYPGEEDITSLDFSNNLKLKEIALTSITKLTSINFGTLSDLTWFSLRGANLVTSIDLSKSLLLDRVDIELSQVTNLDFSLNTNLTQMFTYSNAELTSLNLKNGNNTSISALNATTNSKLTCIQVDNPSLAATYSGWQKDSGASYNTDCSSTWTVMTNPTTTASLLTISGLDADMDGEITLAEAATFTGDANGELNLSGTGITDVEGLQAFTSILKLDVSGNGITDLSPLTNSTFNVIAKSTGKIRTIKKTTTMALETIVLNDNSFNVLDLSSLTNLKEISFKNNPNLITVNIKNGNNANITSFNSSNTPNLSCILVDDINANYLNNWTKDSKSVYVAGEADCRARVLSTDVFDLNNNVRLYPNPITDILNIEISNSLEIKNIKIFTTLGKLIKESDTKTVDFSQLSKGIYLVKIITDKGTAIKKVIKN